MMNQTELRSIGFEGADFLTAKDMESGCVLIRVRTSILDLGETENLPDFIARHGGVDETINYMTVSHAN